MIVWRILFSWLMYGHAGSEAILIKSEPSYVSEWITMTANSTTSHRTLNHDFNEIPAYVRVDARTDAGFIFPAFGSAQQDDDYTMYGGVVFSYNSTHIDIFVSARNNNGNLKKEYAAIYTGTKSSWAGPENLQRIYKSITVQAKAWTSRDLPPPTWKSENINVAAGDCVNTTLRHSLNKYPDWIIIQIRDNQRVFQGQGLSSVGSARFYLQIGGLLFGYNESHVQLWSACDPLGILKGGNALFSVADGWGGPGIIIRSRSGNISAAAWDLTGYQTSYLREDRNVDQVEREGYLQTFTENLTYVTHINLQLEVLDGDNKNFRFDGIGSVMNENAPFGGLVYGYNDTTVAIWLPHADKRDGSTAAVFMLGDIWGWGFKAQMTNNIKIITTIRNVMVPVCIIEEDINATYKISFFNKTDNNLFFEVGAKIAMSCKPGYQTLEENANMVCKAENNGSWSRPPPQCEEIQCPNPVVLNAILVNLNRSIGGQVNLSCVVGSRHVSGDMSRVCRDNGTWDGSPPVCEECRCPCSAVGSVRIKRNETEKLEQRIEELRTLLTIKKNSTVKARLRRVSVTDSRPSAMGLGAVLGGGIIVFIIVALIISDLPLMVSHIRQCNDRNV